MRTYAQDEVSEAARLTIASLLTMNNREFVSQFCKKLGDNPAVMPDRNSRILYQAILDLLKSDEDINALTVWNRIEDDDKFMGGVDDVIQLHLAIAESDPADILANNLMYAEILVQDFRERQDEQRAFSLQGKTGAEFDDAILAEADRILAEQKQDHDIQTGDTIVPFPDDLLADIFKPYAAAFKDKTEVPTPFHFAVLKTVIGASLGRRVYLDATRPIYPNFYTVIIGETGIARKSTALRLGEQLLYDSDMSTFTLRALATPEGLLQLFCPPNGYDLGDATPREDAEDAEPITEQKRYMLQNATPGVEGFRILLSLDEFSALLKKSGKSHGEGLIQMLTEAYDYPVKLDLPTRTNPISADHPCLSIMAATTEAWLESSLKLEDIQGGFANRFNYYHATSAAAIFNSQPGDPKFLNIAKAAVNAYRIKYPQPTAFQFTPEAEQEGEIWYSQHRKQLKAEKNPLIREARARADLHLRKAALLHAAIVNTQDDTEIGLASLEWAIMLTEYLQAVTTHIYSSFNLSEARRLEQRIIDLLTQKPNQTARDLTRRISWASAREVNASIEELLKNQSIKQEQSGRTLRYHVLSEL